MSNSPVALPIRKKDYPPTSNKSPWSRLPAELQLKIGRNLDMPKDMVAFSNASPGSAIAQDVDAMYLETKSRQLTNIWYPAESRRVLVAITKFPDPSDKRWEKDYFEKSDTCPYCEFHRQMNEVLMYSVDPTTDEKQLYIDKATLMKLGPLNDAIWSLKDDFIAKCLSPFPLDAHDIAPRWAHSDFQFDETKNLLNRTMALTGYILQGHKFAKLTDTESDRVMRAFVNYELVCRIIRQIGVFDFGDSHGTHNNTASEMNRGFWKFRKFFHLIAAFKVEEVVCIYRYIRHLWRIIFFELELCFVEELNEVYRLYCANPLSRALKPRRGPSDDPGLRWEQELSYDEVPRWPAIFRTYDPSQITTWQDQDGFIDILCSFGLAYVHSVLQMDAAARKKEIISTYYAFWKSAAPVPMHRWSFLGVLDSQTAPQAAWFAPAFAGDSLEDGNLAWKEYGMHHNRYDKAPNVIYKVTDYLHDALRKRGYVFWEKERLEKMGLDRFDRMVHKTGDQPDGYGIPELPYNMSHTVGWKDFPDRSDTGTTYNISDPLPYYCWRVLFDRWGAPDTTGKEDREILNFSHGITFRLKAPPFEPGKHYNQHIQPMVDRTTLLHN